MILSYYSRVVFWGCEIQGKTLHVGLGFIAPNMTMKKLWLKDSDGVKVCTIELPEDYLKAFQPRRVSSISFNII